MSSILVPFDASAHAYKALHIACDLSEKYKAPLALIHIAGSLKTAPNEQRANQVKAAAEKKLKHRSLTPIAIEIAYGDAAECILIAAKKYKSSTIVMGCRGLAPQESESADTTDEHAKMFGSVSQAVFLRADCTCISVK